nr:telomeric repeat-binding factor 2-like [Nerophis lumbriciformis]
MADKAEYQETEPLVTRWLMDYLTSLAWELFEKDKYNDFCAVRDLISSVLLRPVGKNEVINKKVLVMQLLSRVNEGERLDMTFENNDPISPLESALQQLESMYEGSNIPQEDLKKVCNSVKEMIVKLFIKDNMFSKAEEALCNFPKAMTAKKEIYMDLINRRTNNHKVIEEINFKQLKEEISAFCVKFCPCSDPLLHETAKNVINRIKRRRKESMTSDDTEECYPSNPLNAQGHAQPLICDDPIIPKKRLKIAYQALAVADRITIPFSELEEEVQKEITVSFLETEDTDENSETEELFEENSESSNHYVPPTPTKPLPNKPHSKNRSPQNRAREDMRASVRKRKSNKMAKMVMDPDSQESSLGLSQEVETTVRAEELQNGTCETPHTDTEAPQLRRIQLATQKRSSPDDVETTPPPQHEEQSCSSPAINEVSLRTPHKEALPNGIGSESEESSDSAHVIPSSPVNNETPEEQRSNRASNHGNIAGDQETKNLSIILNFKYQASCSSEQEKQE